MYSTIVASLTIGCFAYCVGFLHASKVRHPVISFALSNRSFPIVRQVPNVGQSSTFFRILPYKAPISMERNFLSQQRKNLPRGRIGWIPVVSYVLGKRKFANQS